MISFLSPARPIPILILGLKSSGKTDIAFRLLNKKRDEFLSTNGCRVFTTKINKRLIKFTELGGEEFYDIWKYYFLDVSSP
jgi:AAA+ ATPase superfamily predicted ATPase